MNLYLDALDYTNVPYDVAILFALFLISSLILFVSSCRIVARQSLSQKSLNMELHVELVEWSGEMNAIDRNSTLVPAKTQKRAEGQHQVPPQGQPTALITKVKFLLEVIRKFSLARFHEVTIIKLWSCPDLGFNVRDFLMRLRFILQSLISKHVLSAYKLVR